MNTHLLQWKTPVLLKQELQAFIEKRHVLSTMITSWPIFNAHGQCIELGSCIIVYRESLEQLKLIS